MDFLFVIDWQWGVCVWCVDFPLLDIQIANHTQKRLRGFRIQMHTNKQISNRIRLARESWSVTRILETAFRRVMHHISGQEQGAGAGAAGKGR